MAQLAEREIPMNAQIARYVADYQRAQNLAQPKWLAKARESALADFSRLGFPTTRLEEWRFTPVGAIADKYFAIASDGMPADARLIESLVPESLKAVCINGHFSQKHSTLEHIPRGVQILNLSSVLATNPGLVESYLTKIAPSAQQAFTALNTAFLRDGLVIHLAPHAVIETPLEVVFASAPDGTATTVSHPRLLIVAGEGSQATILERYVGSGSTLTNAVTEVILGANAVVDHYKVQEESQDAFHIASMNSFRGCSRDLN